MLTDDGLRIIGTDVRRDVDVKRPDEVPIAHKSEGIIQWVPIAHDSLRHMAWRKALGDALAQEIEKILGFQICKLLVSYVSTVCYRV
jgi:hypothetical protein